MIHLITKGGLGNQMFQYAFALQIKRKYPEDSVCIHGILHPFSRDKRQLSLHHFRLDKKTKISGFIHSSVIFFCFVIQIIQVLGIYKSIRIFSRDRAKIISQKEESFNSRGAYFSTRVYTLPEIKNNLACNKYIFAYCQKPQVIDGIEEELRRAFTVKTPPSPENEALLQEIKSQNSVCVHIRRGDYALYPQLQVCTEHYYATAVRHAHELLENPVFYIFSTGHEDVEWVRQNYHFEGNFRYVDLDNVDYEELRLMMACKHFIISNSTFSWWAAVLSNETPDKKVWTPKSWLAQSSVEMHLPGWNVIETSS